MQGRRFRRKSDTYDNDVNRMNDRQVPLQQPPSQRRTVADLAIQQVNSNDGVIDYVSMSSSGDGSRSRPVTANAIPETFVTQPPRPAKGLTGKISTLFRRESSRERDVQNYPAGSDGVLSSAMGGSSSAALSPSTVGSSVDRGSTSIPSSPSPKSRWSTSRRSQSTGRIPATSATTAIDVPSTIKSHRRVKSRSDHNSDVIPNPSHSKHSSTDHHQQHSAPKLKREHSTGKRIFYSSHQDDDSDDSYESRASAASRGSRASQARRQNKHRTAPSTMNSSTADDISRSVGTSGTGNAYESSSFTDLSNDSGKLIKRYRGFSTSIKSLFLDESLVCGACGCFGLILSNRTEYLLQLRNERRGTSSKRGRHNQSNRRSIMPSRIIATGLAFTLLLMFSTFIIWGFGTGDDVASSYLNGYDYHEDSESSSAVSNDDKYNYNAVAADDDEGDNNNDDANRRRGLDQKQNLSAKHKVLPTGYRPYGVITANDFEEFFTEPIRNFMQHEWYRSDVNDELNNSTVTKMHLRRDEETEATDDTSSNSGNRYAETEYERDLASDIRVALFLSFLLFLGVLGRRRRMRTRYYLVRARAQEDHLYYASSDEAAARRVAFDDTREDQYEGACSHTLCGCYPVDEVDNMIEDFNVQVTDNGIFRRKSKPFNEDIVARSFNCCLATCCGSLCRCWFQCLSICALAQEAREVRLLIPPRYQRIDYITHQPFHEYQEAVNDLRRGWMGKARKISGLMPHYNALSRLSRYILVLSLMTVLAIVATLLFNPRAAFSWQDAIVLVATFLQSFFVLFFVHWIFHKSDLSLDAVIKLFAAGFLIAVPTAFFFEGLLINIMYYFIYLVYGVLASIFGENFSSWVDNNWRIIAMMGEVVNAFVVAAITEELCKYYTFRCVEHPDLVFLTGLQRDTQEEDAVEGGLVNYPFASHQVQELARKNSFRDDGSVSEHSHRSNRSNRSRSRSRHETLIERTGTTDAEFDEDDQDVRTRRQKAMAITTGMISVAVGLACAENFIYVFVMGGANEDDPLEAWILLFFRSIFPIHALAAAMQSINMIRKFVEFDHQNGHRVGVGRIILPAVILHGSFDAVLLGINVFVVTATDNYVANGGIEGDALPYNAFIVNLVAWVSIIGIMILGLLWYFRENRNQNLRLKVLEEQDKAIQTDQWLNGTNTHDDEEDIL